MTNLGTPRSDIADPPVLSIIIPTYTASKAVEDCLNSLMRNGPREPYEIILVDDASHDGTCEMVRDRFPHVRVLQNPVNRGYSYSNNRAIRCARGRYLLLLNNDTIVLPNAIDDMLAFLREYPEAGGVGCKLLNEDGTIQWSVKSLPSAGAALYGARSIITRLWPGNPLSRRHLLHFDADMTRPFVAGLVSGAAYMLPKHVADEVGELDEELFYHVDADYCKRMADLGYYSYYLPTAEIIHSNHKGGSKTTWRRRLRSHLLFHTHSYIYYRKHLRKSAWDPMNLVVILGLSARFALSFSVLAAAEVLATAYGISAAAVGSTTA